MEIARTIQEVRERIANFKQKHNNSAKIGFIPTMGYLHAGHASLFVKAREACDFVVVSIFVNPLQFGPKEDFSKYPRDEEHDLQIAGQAGADLVFLPSVEEIYPKKVLTHISVQSLTNVLCGASRPGHFDGVAAVVLKLFHIVEPDCAFFGLKDAQQVAVIQQLVDDLNINISIMPCDIVREADGLAMSSRNVYLSPEERKQAVILSQSLNKIGQWLQEGSSAAELKNKMIRHIQTEPLAQIDYVEILKYPSLEELGSDMDWGKEQIIAALAVKFGNTRLIDNRILFAD